MCVLTLFETGNNDTKACVLTLFETGNNDTKACVLTLFETIIVTAMRKAVHVLTQSRLNISKTGSLKHVFPHYLEQYFKH